MIGRVISQYTIIEKIGGGGMGVVFKAEDSTLKRPIAIKFLTPELIYDNVAKERFISEAQAASALEHSNICNIHEIGETKEGELFIVMAYYTGETLTKKIKKGPLDFPYLTDISIQIAKGLLAAHEAGIVHRDIKPENIFLTEKNEVKLLDFGLAKVKGQSKLTRQGSTLGTLFYVSPEQMKGEEVDLRGDIWSFGIVLFEMITGQLPFEGDYEAAIMYSVLNEEPKSIETLREAVPPFLRNIVKKALSKNVEERWQSFEEILHELNNPESFIKSGKKTKSIVVLPFDDMSPDKDNEYFSDGLTEEIITDLSQIKDFRVISRSSAMTLKGTNKSVKTISEELNVQYVLEGSVRKAGNDLKMTAQLIDADSDTHLWAEKYKGTLDDVFDIQEKVSRSIVDTLKIQLSPLEQQKIKKIPIDNIKVYECWLRARQAIFDWTENSHEQALHYLNKGLEIIGENATLYAGMGFLHMFYFNSGTKLDPELLEQSENFLKKANKLDPDISLAHYVKGMIAYLRGDIREAINLLENAVKEDPGQVDSLGILVYIYAMLLGKPEVSVKLSEKLLEKDPLTPLNYLGPTFISWSKGDFSEALLFCEKYYNMTPNNIHARFWYIYLLFWNNKINEALPILSSLSEEFYDHTLTRIIHFVKSALDGNTIEAHEALSEEIQKFAMYHSAYARILAEGYALLNEKEESLKYLERAMELGWINFPSFSEEDPFLENIRSEERYKELMYDVKMKWEGFTI